MKIKIFACRSGAADVNAILVHGRYPRIPGELEIIVHTDAGLIGWDLPDAEAFAAELARTLGHARAMNDEITRERAILAELEAGRVPTIVEAPK